MTASAGDVLPPDGVQMATCESAAGYGRRGGHVDEGTQDEGPFVHPRMRNAKPAHLHPAAAV